MTLKISDLLDGIQDDTVPLREKEVIASERIKEATMAKINRTSDDSAVAAKRLGRGAMAAIAAAACLALSGTAFAAGFMDRLINWQGETIETVQEPLATEAPADEEDAAARQTLVQELLDSGDSDVLVVVKYTDENGVTHSETSQRAETFTSAAAFDAVLTEQESLLQTFNVPEDYDFLSAQITYDCAGGYTYLSTETADYGLTVERYTVSEGGSIVSGYMAEYQNAAGARLTLEGQLLDGEVEFVADDSTAVRTASVEGMDSALVFEQKNGETVLSATVTMSQALAEPVAYVSSALLTGAQPTEGDSMFSQVWYTVSADRLDGDELLALLTS